MGQRNVKRCFSPNYRLFYVVPRHPATISSMKRLALLFLIATCVVTANAHALGSNTNDNDPDSGTSCRYGPWKWSH